MSKVSVLIATYENDDSQQKYLDACLKSLHAQTYKDIEIILVSTGKYLPLVDVDIHCHQKERLHFPEAIMKASAKMSNSEYVLLCNDDIIASQTAIEQMVGILKMENLILNPMSNCDQLRQFLAPLYVKTLDDRLIEFSQQDRMVNVLPYVDDIIERSCSFTPMVFFRQWVAFYFSAMRRSTWDQIGGLDPKFKTGQDDLDFCLRAEKQNIRSAILTSTFVYHFSGVSADKHLDTETRNSNIEYFNEKWKRS